jgi:biopolymer transport protein ExbD
MANVQQSDNEIAEPNLVPILDMVFQLITFFMLVINIKNKSIDETLKLPIIGSARTVDTKGQEDLMILNINEGGDLVVYGAVRKDWERVIANEAAASMRVAKRDNPNFNISKDELPTTVVFRGAQKVPYGKVHPMIQEAQKHGFRKFQFRALNKPPEEKK